MRKIIINRENIGYLFTHPLKAVKGLLPGYLVNRNVKTTREGYIFMGLIFAVGIAAINTGNNLLYLVLAMLMATLLASFSLSEYSIREIKLTREIPHHVHAGADFQMSYLMENLKRFFPSVNILIEDYLGRPPVRALFGQVSAGLQERISIPAKVFRRGRLKFDKVVISTRYPFGFFIKSKNINLPGEVLAYPTIEEIRGQAKIPNARRGSVMARTKGEGTDLFGFREYRRGDSPRILHWKTTARAGRMMVREHEREQERSICLELEVQGPRPKKDDPAREAAVIRAASLAYHYIYRGYRVRVEREGRGIDFGIGLDHLQRIMLFLALFDDPDAPALGERLRGHREISLKVG